MGGAGDPAPVMAADRAFAREVATAVGPARARIWADWFAPDGRQVVPGQVISGREAILALMGPAFADPGYSLAWDPDQGGISDDRTQGWTSGRYTSIRSAPDPDAPPAAAHGRYVTIWARQDDGTWKVVLDMGIGD